MLRSKIVMVGVTPMLAGNGLGKWWSDVAGEWQGWGKGFADNGRYAWGKMRRGYLKEGWVEKYQAIHHRLIPVGGTRGGTGALSARGFFTEQWGRYVPNFIKNSKWNLRRVADEGFTSAIHDAIHGTNPRLRMGVLRRLYYGSNIYDKAAVGIGVSGGGYLLYESLNDEEGE